MLWVGLTGGIASGKSSVVSFLRAKGYPVIDADELAHEVTRKGTAGYSEVVKEFGSDIVSKTNGELDRAKLAEIVFRDPADRSRLKRLEEIVHPRVRDLAFNRKAEFEKQGAELAFYDVPLLFEKNLESLFDRVVVVACAPDLQLSRLMARNNLKREEALSRIAAQLPVEEKIRRAQFLIRNDGSLSDLENAVAAFLANLR